MNPHRLNRKPDLRDMEDQILAEKFMEDMQMAIKMFALKTNMRRLRKNRQMNKVEASCTSYDLDLDSNKEDGEDIAQQTELMSCYKEVEEIGPITLSFVLMLRLVLKHSLDEVPTQQDSVSCHASQSFLDQMHRGKCETFDKDNYEPYDDTSVSAMQQYLQPSDQNILPPVDNFSIPFLPNVNSNKSSNTNFDNCAELKQDVCPLFDNEFNEYLSSIIPSITSCLCDEFEKCLNKSVNSIELSKPMVDSDWQSQMLVQPKSVVDPAKTNVRPIVVDLENGCELANFVTEIRPFSIYSDSETEEQPKPNVLAVQHNLVQLFHTKKLFQCAQCNKKLHITNIYKCLCEKIFCSHHIYSEYHGCTYNYKSEARDI